MEHVEKLEKSFCRVTELIESYESFQQNKPDFIPKREKTWEKIPRADELKTSIAFINSQKKRLKHWQNTVELASIFQDEVILQSTPNSFMLAYRTLVGVDLDTSDLWQIKELGANIIPLDPSVRNRQQRKFQPHSVFRSSEAGFRYYPKGASTNVIRAGTAQGKYKDKAQLETIFYDTALNPKNLIQCRYIEYLSELLFDNSDSGLIIQMTAKLNVKTDNGSEEFSIMNVMSFCEVQPYSRWPEEIKALEEDIYGHQMLMPLLLKPLNHNDARKKLGIIQDLNKENSHFDIRSNSLSQEQVKNWNYNKIKPRSVQRKELRNYIKTNQPKCGHHSDAHTKKCTGMTVNNFQVGHILSQSWSQSYHIFKESVHHPDNLYLTCGSCNASLNRGGPSKTVLEFLNREYLTLGDLLRKGKIRLLSDD